MQIYILYKWNLVVVFREYNIQKQTNGKLKRPLKEQWKAKPAFKAMAKVPKNPKSQVKQKGTSQNM